MMFKTCVICGEEFRVRNFQALTCSPAHNRERIRFVSAVYRNDNRDQINQRNREFSKTVRPPLYFATCSECGKRFAAKNPRYSICSPVCRAGREKVRSQRRREQSCKPRLSRCAVCRKEYSKEKTKLTCSESCAFVRLKRRRASDNARRRPPVFLCCVICGAPFRKQGGRQKTCLAEHCRALLREQYNSSHRRLERERLYARRSDIVEKRSIYSKQYRRANRERLHTKASDRYFWKLLSYSVLQRLGVALAHLPNRAAKLTASYEIIKRFPGVLTPEGE
jgi:hypothetical protein